MLERRRVPRTKVLKNAKIVLAGVTLSCVTHNLTNYGACLHLLNAAILPRIFYVSFDAGHTLRPCRVIWRSTTSVSVSFEQQLLNGPLSRSVQAG